MDCGRIDQQDENDRPSFVLYYVLRLSSEGKIEHGEQVLKIRMDNERRLIDISGNFNDERIVVEIREEQIYGGVQLTCTINIIDDSVLPIDVFGIDWFTYPPGMGAKGCQIGFVDHVAKYDRGDVKKVRKSSFWWGF
jgi:hypothetical protein